MRMLAAGALIFGALLIVAACGGPADDGSGPRRIVYWEKWTGFEGEAAQAVVDAFNAAEREKAAETPGYRPIEVEMVTVSKLDQKLLVAIAGGNPPDVAGAWTWLVYSYSEKGALTALDDRLAESWVGPDHYLPAFWEMCRYQGQTWCLPTTPASTALHWNKRLLREAGLDPEQGPVTLLELEEMARRCTVWEVTLEDGSTERRRGWLHEVGGTSQRLVQAGFLPNEPNWWPWGWGYYHGGALWDPASGNITADAPGNIAAYDWVRRYAELIGIDHLRRFASGFGGFATPNNPFMDGKVAMEIQGVWMFNFIDQYAPGMDWGVAAFPYPDGRPELANCSNVEADVLVIPKDSKNPDEAWAFMEFVASRQGMELLCLGHRKFSPLTTVSPSFASEHPHPAVDLFRDLAQHANGFSTPKMGIWNEYKRELQVAFDRAIDEPDTASAAILQAVDARIQASLDRNARLRAAREGR